MEIIPFIYDTDDELLANTYLIKDKSSRCVVVDPSSNYDGIINYIKKNNLSLKAILITHAHFDHIGGLDRLAKAFNVPTYAHYEELETFINPHLNCSEDFSIKGIKANTKITIVDDGEIIKVLDEDIKVIHTPYHTRGSICFYLPISHLLFSGDSLFLYSFGRSDLPTSIPSKTKESINKLMELNDDTKVYPGHGRFTNIGNERKFLYMHEGYRK